MPTVFYITSVYAGFESSRITSNPVTCSAGAVPPAPTNVTMSCSGLTVSAAWTEPNPNTGLTYRIYRGAGTTPVWLSATAVNLATNFTTLPAWAPRVFYITSMLNGVESGRTASNSITCVATPIYLQWVTTTSPAYPVRQQSGANKQAFFKVKVSFADGTPVYTATVSIFDTGTNPATLKGILSPLGTTGVFGLQPASAYGDCYNIPTTTNLTVRVDASYNGANASLTGTATSSSVSRCP